MPSINHEPILLTGASGYVGGRLLIELEANGKKVRCLARHPEYLLPRVKKTTTVVRGDVLDIESLTAALDGIHTAFYLVHSMQDGERFEILEREGAANFARAAKAANVRRIIYLGGLGDDHGRLSAHLRSRHDVGEILRSFGGVCLELRASIVIGSGSLSFEIVRALVERLPIMITPRWVRVLTQPISIGDLISVLVRSIDVPVSESAVFEIGGRDRISYGGIMEEYARQRGLKRLMIPVPFLTPHLSGLWLGLVTPVYARIGRTLVKSIQNPTVVRDNAMEKIFGVSPHGLRESIQSALQNEDNEFAATRWCDAVSTGRGKDHPAVFRPGTRFVDTRTVRVAVSPEEAFEPIRRIGGKEGWYFGNFLWHVRGIIDLLVGGAGLRRGRRHPSELFIGDALDFWRVESYEPNKLLRLRAEMKLPGRAWLQFEIKEGNSGAQITQTALFDPSGIAGLLYWYLLYPIHCLIFSGMLRQIKRRAEAFR